MVEKYNISEQIKLVINNFRRSDTDLSLGFPMLEKFFDNRGFPPGTFTCMLGKSKVGKTSFVINSMADLASREEKVLFFSLEMSASAVLVKFSRLILQKHPWSIRQLIQHDPDGAKFLVQKFRNQGLLDNLKIIDGSRDNVAIDIDYMRRSIDEYHPKVVFIDHLHLVRTRQSSDIYAQTTDVSNSLAALSKMTGVIVFALVQISRGDSGTKASDGSVLPTLSGGKGSGAIEENADCIIGIARPDISPSVSTEMRGKILVGILGNRYGESSPPLTYMYDSDSTALVFEDDFIGAGGLYG